MCATGKAGWAAPRLKDAALSEDRLREGYVEVYQNHFHFYFRRCTVTFDLKQWKLKVLEDQQIACKF